MDLSQLEELEFQLHNCMSTKSTEVDISISCRFRDLHEYWRWALSLASVAASIDYSSLSPLTMLPKIDAYGHSKSSSQQQQQEQEQQVWAGEQGEFWTPILLRFSTVVIANIAERHLVHRGLRSVRLTGAAVKTVRFRMVNRSLVVRASGMCPAFTEGSVLLSVNNLSAVTVPAQEVLKYIADLPRHLSADFVFWKFSRSRFQVRAVVKSKSLLASASTQFTAAGEPAAVSPLRFGGGSSGGGASAMLSPSSPSPMWMMAEHERTQAIAQQDRRDYKSPLQSQKYAQGHLHALSRGSSPDRHQSIGVTTDTTDPANWTVTTLEISNGTASLNIGGKMYSFELAQTRLEVVFNDASGGVLDLALDLSDPLSRIVVAHSDLKQFILMTETLVQAMKLMGSVSADMGRLFDGAVSFRSAALDGYNAAQQSDPTMLSLLDYAVVSDDSNVDYLDVYGSGGKGRRIQNKNRSRGDISISLGTGPDSRGIELDGEDEYNEEEEADGDGDDDAGTDVDIDDDFEYPNQSMALLMAAESLEATLNDLNIPHSMPFPSLPSLTQLVEAIASANRQNHELLAKLIPLEVRGLACLNVHLVFRSIS